MTLSRISDHSWRERRGTDRRAMIRVSENRECRSANSRRAFITGWTGDKHFDTKVIKLIRKERILARPESLEVNLVQRTLLPDGHLSFAHYSRHIRC